MKDLIQIRKQIDTLAQNPTIEVWYELEKISHTLGQETWNTNLDYAWEAELLSRYTDNICINIYQNNLLEFEQKELDNYIKKKYKKGVTNE